MSDMLSDYCLFDKSGYRMQNILYTHRVMVKIGDFP